MEKTMTFAQKLERAFVELVDSRAEARHFGKGESAAKVWPDVAPKAATSR